MTHLNEEDLILHYYGEDAGGAAQTSLVIEDFERHLAECAACRENYRSLRLVLNTVDTAPLPERGDDYGERVWRRIQGKLGRRSGAGGWSPRWWVLAPVAAALLTIAFFAGRFTQPASKPVVVTQGQVRERVLLIAVVGHLDRSQLVLAEISNTPDGKANRKVDISSERRIAGDLLDDNRLYRQTARRTGDTAVASILEDLDRVLLEIAHSPSEVSGEQLARLQQEIEDRGLLFKVRVIGSQLRRREDKPLSPVRKQGTKL